MQMELTFKQYVDDELDGIRDNSVIAKWVCIATWLFHKIFKRYAADELDDISHQVRQTDSLENYVDDFLDGQWVKTIIMISIVGILVDYMYLWN